MAGLMYHKPSDHITFLQQCLARAREIGGDYKWDTFIYKSTLQDSSPQSRQLFSTTKPLPPIPGDGTVKTQNKLKHKLTDITLPPISNGCTPSEANKLPHSSSDEKSSPESTTSASGHPLPITNQTQSNFRQEFANKPVIFVLGKWVVSGDHTLTLVAGKLMVVSGDHIILKCDFNIPCLVTILAG